MALVDVARLIFRVDSRQVDRAADDLKDLNRASRSAQQGMNGLSAAADLAQAAFAALMGIGLVRDLMQLTMTLQRVRMTFQFIAGDAKLATMQFERFSEAADTIGQNILEVAPVFTSFAAAAKTTGLSFEDSLKTFQGVSAAMLQMGRSTADTQGALVALQQILSKGKVTAEEVTQQFGERLPGGVALAAEAMGFGQDRLKDFFKAMEQGKLSAQDFVRNVGDLLFRRFAEGLSNNVDNVNRKLSEFDNAIDALKVTIVDTGFQDALISILDFVRDIAASETAKSVAEGLGAAFKVVAGAVQLLAPYAETAAKALIALTATAVVAGLVKLGGLIAGIGAALLGWPGIIAGVAVLLIGMFTDSAEAAKLTAAEIDQVLASTNQLQPAVEGLSKAQNAYAKAIKSAGAAHSSTHATIMAETKEQFEAAKRLAALRAREARILMNDLVTVRKQISAEMGELTMTPLARRITGAIQMTNQELIGLNITLGTASKAYHEFRKQLIAKPGRGELITDAEIKRLNVLKSDYDRARGALLKQQELRDKQIRDLATEQARVRENSVAYEKLDIKLERATIQYEGLSKSVAEYNELLKQEFKVAATDADTKAKGGGGDRIKRMIARLEEFREGLNRTIKENGALMAALDGGTEAFERRKMALEAAAEANEWKNRAVAAGLNLDQKVWDALAKLILQEQQSNQALRDKQAALAKVKQLSAEYGDETRGLKEELAELMRLRPYLQQAEDLAILDQRISEVRGKISDLEVYGANGLRVIEDVGTTVFRGLERAIDQFAETGKVNFRELTVSILKDIALIISKMLIMDAIIKGLQSAGLGGLAKAIGSAAGVAVTPLAGAVGASFVSAGNFASTSFAGAPAVYHEGGSAGSSSAYPGRRRLMSDEYPAILREGERVLPRGATAGGSTMVQIIDQRQQGADIEEEETTGADGRRRLRLYIRDAVQQEMANGGFDASMRTNYGLSRRTTR